MTTPVELIINGRDNTQGAFASAGGGLAKIGQIAMGILTSQVFTALTRGVMNFTTSIITEAREAALVQADLEAVLKSTGGVAGVTAGMVEELSKKISENSKYTDEDVKSAQVLLLTFTNIGKDIFPQATQATADLAARFKMDLSSASIMVGKALNDPIKGVAALGRAGVQFSEDQKKMIKAMVETGDLAGAQEMILGELAMQTEGAAASQVTSWEKLQHKFDNIKEELGTSLLPMIDKLGDMLSKALDDPAVQAAIEFLVKWLGNSLPLMLNSLGEDFGNVKTFISDAGQGIKDFVEPFIPALQSIMGTFDKMRPSIQAIASLLGQRLAAAGTQLSSKVFPFLVAQLKKFADWFSANRPLIVSFIATMAQRFAFFANAIVKFWNVVQPLLAGFFDLILGLAKFVMQIATGDWSGAWDTIVETVSNAGIAIGETLMAFFDWIAGLFGGSLAGIKAQWTTNWNLFKSILSQVWTIIVTTITTKLNAIRTAFSTAWNNIIATARAFGSNLIASIVSSINNAISGATGALSGFISLGSNIINYIITGLRNNTASLVNYLKGIITNLVSSIIGGGSGVGPVGGQKSATRGASSLAADSLGSVSTVTSVNYYNAHISNFYGSANSRNIIKGLT